MNKFFALQMNQFLVALMALPKTFFPILGLFITLSLLWPLFFAPYFSHHDNVQVIRLFEMDKCIKDGQIPCRWVPNLGGEYGYPLFNYYAPLPYYVGEIFYLLTLNFLVAAKMMFATAFIGSFIFMYLLGRKLWGVYGGSLSAIFYSLAPYHSVDFYVRGAMGELWGLMFYPGLFWAIWRLKERVNAGNCLLVAAMVGLLIISHNLSAMLFLPITLFLIGLLFLREVKELKFLKYIFFALILGIFLAAFYLLPVIFEKNLVHVDTTTYGYFSYTEHFKGLKKLFIDRSWGWGASVREVPGGEKDGLSFQIGWIHLLGWLLAVYSLRYFWKKKSLPSLVIIFSTAVILLSVFMIHPKSEFVWKLIDPLKYVQFPWRFIGLIIFFISLVSGSVFLILETKYKNLIWFGLVALVLAFNFSYFRPEKFLYLTERDYLTGSLYDQQIKRSIFDYLPIYAKEPPAELATKRYEILTGNTQINNFQEGTNWIKFNATTKTHTIIRLSQYYFPNWKIFVDGKPIKIDYENHLGLMTFILGVGNHQVEARLLNTQIRILGNALTSFGILLLIILLVLQIPKIRKWSLYYLNALNR